MAWDHADSKDLSVSLIGSILWYNIHCNDVSQSHSAYRISLLAYSRYVLILTRVVLGQACPSGAGSGDKLFSCLCPTEAFPRYNGFKTTQCMRFSFYLSGEHTSKGHHP